jgi:RND family efflux transporter MFP subunit
MERSVSGKARFLRFIWGTIPWLAVICIVVFVVMMFGKISEEKKRLEEERRAALAQSVPATRVITLTLTPLRLEDKINLPAEVETLENLWVKAEVPGQVVSVHVKEGQQVKEGQLLVRLDSRDYRSRVASIEANYKYALEEFNRISALAKRKIAAASQLDQVEANLKALKAQRNEARLALSRTQIKAPIRGRLNEMEAEVGEYLPVGREVAQILQMEQVKVTVGVPESDVAAIFDLDSADVILEALNNRRVRGEKVFLSRQPRSLARLYNLELVVANPDGRILPGMFARVELVKEVFEDAITVPLYAVITRGDNYYVFIEKEGKAEMREVKLGILSEWQVQVQSGLNPGEKVIVVGQRGLDDGQKVQVIKNVARPEEILSS